MSTINHAIRLHRQGDLAGAEKGYRDALLARPGDPTALHYLGMILHQQGKSQEGMGFVRKSIDASPAVADFHCNLGVILRDLGQLDEAIAAICTAVRLRPKYPEALNNLGDVLLKLGRLKEARTVLGQSIEISPSVDALNNLAMVCIGQKDWLAAIDVSRDCLKLKETDAKARKNLARALRGAGDISASIAAWQRATELNPSDAEAHFGLGDAHRAAGELPSAIACYEKANALRPGWHELLTNYMATLIDSAQIPRAIEIGKEAVEAGPRSHESRYNLSLALLCDGQFTPGWEFYESRWHCEGFINTQPPLPQPAWVGGDLRGKTILIRAEQGCGDAIQFARYIPLLSRSGATVILQCHAELADLLATVPGVSRVFTRDQTPDGFDLHVPMLSIARYLTPSAREIPANVPYLHADAKRSAAMAKRLSNLPGPKIGLVWAGNPIHPNDKNRSLPPAVLSPLSAVSGVTFISLQKNARSLPPIPNLVDLSPYLEDFADTAAAISQLDLLISADTSSAHLAGALGLNVWTLIPFAPDWRWMLNRNDSPWYPTMQLYRQASAGDWAGVVERISTDLSLLRLRKAA